MNTYMISSKTRQDHIKNHSFIWIAWKIKNYDGFDWKNKIVWSACDSSIYFLKLFTKAIPNFDGGMELKGKKNSESAYTVKVQEKTDKTLSH